MKVTPTSAVLPVTTTRLDSISLSRLIFCSTLPAFFIQSNAAVTAEVLFGMTDAPSVAVGVGDVAALSPSRSPVFMQPHRAALSARMQTKIERHLRKFMIKSLPCSPILHRKGFF